MIDCQDVYARYKMAEPKIRTKHKLTYITNISDIVKTMNTMVLYIVKFLSKELNTMVKHEPKTKEIRINGIYSKEDIIHYLREFVRLYLLCSICNLPELDHVCKKKYLAMKCRSCGNYSKCDLSDKVYKLMQQTISLKPKKKKENKIKKELMEIGVHDDDGIWCTESTIQERRKEIEENTFLKKLIQ